VSCGAAAGLACGPDAVLSHASAAGLWGFLARSSFPLEVTASGRRERPGITAHRCQSFLPRDIARQRGIPTTRPTRSWFEDDLLAFIAKYGLPKPADQLPLQRPQARPRSVNRSHHTTRLAKTLDHEATRLIRILNRRAR
jgi:hypothetical protein